MADLVNLQDRLKAKQHEVVKYLERMDLTAKMIPVMVETVEKFTSMGRKPGSHRSLSSGNNRRDHQGPMIGLGA